MCGITGSLGASSFTPDALAAMAKTLAHRGPDHTGTLFESPVALAMTRLSIIDLSTGNQPMHSPDGQASLVFNGEIYNYRELRKELEEKIPFRTTSDTEVIINGYVVWGEEVFRRLNGIFAVALWDRARKKLLLARDPLGTKPLYLLDTPLRLYFSSEIKTFTQLKLANDVNMDAILQFLSAGYVFHPHTAIRGVTQLGPGQMLIAGADGSRETKTFRLPGANRQSGVEKWPRKAGAGLMDAIVAQTVADVPYGLLLSSGLDSMAIVAALHRKGLAENLRTYTVAFDNEQFGEQQHVRKLAEAWGFRNTLVPLGPDQVKALWSAACLTYDNLELLPTALGIQEASRVAGADLRILLAGNGGDEVFLGYPTYVATDIVRRFGGALAPILPLLRRALPLLPASDNYLSRSEKIRRFVTGFDRDPALAHSQWRYVFPNDSVRDLLGRAPSAARIYAPQTAHYRDAAKAGYTGSDVDSWGDLRSWLVDCGLMMWDKAGMSAGVEIRVPLIDPDFLDLAFSAPASVRAGKKMGTKQVLREILAPHLPEEILALPKHGFQLPVAEWLRGPLKPMFRDLTADLPPRLFKRGAIDTLWKRFENRTGDHALQIWALGALSGWARAHHVNWG